MGDYIPVTDSELPYGPRLGGAQTFGADYPTAFSSHLRDDDDDDDRED